MGVGDFSGFALHGSEVGIGLVPSFLTVIFSRGHWCRSLDFDGSRLAVLFRHLVLKGKFPNYFSFYYIISNNPLGFCIELSWFICWKIVLFLIKTSHAMQIHALLLVVFI